MNQNTIQVTINGQDNTRGAIDGVGKGLRALGGLISAGLGFEKLASGFTATTDAANRTNNALLGLGSIALAYGQNIDATNQAAKSLASDGLMSVSDSATGLKNLLATGFSLDQATELMNRFKDSAAFGRQSALGFGEAIASATEGIKNGNSILVDNAGVTKNLSVLLEEAGYSQQDVGKAAGDAGVRQAIYNGILRETSAQTGDATRLSKTFSGAQAQLGTTIFNTKAKIGDMLEGGVLPLLSGLISWMNANQQVVVSLALAGGAVLGFISVLAGGAGLVTAAMTVAAVLGGPLTLILVAVSALLGGIVFNAMQKVQKQMAATTNTVSTGAGNIGSKGAAGLGKAAKGAEDLSKKLADIATNMREAEADFQQSLVRMVTDHQNKVKDLQTQLADEGSSFDESNYERNRAFNDSLATMKADHAEKVADIEDQLNQELAKGEFANRRQVAELQERLMKENLEYDKQTAKLTNDYDSDVARAKAAHDKKVAATQAELDGELALLNKHAGDVRAVQGVMLKDEIDQLKESHRRQLASFDQQKNDAISKASQSASGVAGAFNNIPNMINKDALNGAGNQMGKNFADALKKAFADSFADFWNWTKRTLKQDAMDIANGDFFKGLAMWGKANRVPGFASGTSFAPGGMALVGERGPELVSLPRGSSVTKASDTADMLSGTSIQVQELHIHLDNGADASFWDKLGRGQELRQMGLVG